MRAMISTLLFELSGVLVDWDKTVSLLVKDLRSEAPAEFRRGLRKHLRGSVTELDADGRYCGLLADPARAWRLAMPGAAPATVSTFARRSLELLDITLYDEVPATLLSMREQYSMGVISDLPAGKSIIVRTGIAHLFDALVSPPKTRAGLARADIRRALRNLKAAPGETAYIGCNVGGLRESTNLGVTTIWVARKGGRVRTLKGLKHVASLEELPELLATL